MRSAILAAVSIGALALTQAVPAPATSATPPSVPTAELLTTSSVGRTTTAATLSWARVCLHYVDGTADPEWVAGMVRLIGDLDPAWQTPWAYGILMIPTNTEVGEQLTREAMVRFPDTPWFARVLEARFE